MSRDHYGNIPKKRAALVNDEGDLEALELGGDINEVRGSVTLAGGTATISGSYFKSDSIPILTPEHDGPTDVNVKMYDGYMTVSGTGNGKVFYHVKS